jgi:hypothetical protein
MLLMFSLEMVSAVSNILEAIPRLRNFSLVWTIPISPGSSDQFYGAAHYRRATGWAFSDVPGRWTKIPW